MTNIKWCIEYLKKYNNIFYNINDNEENQFRSLMNITMPYDLSYEYYQKEEIVLKNILNDKNIFDTNDLTNGISLYKGDITLLNPLICYFSLYLKDKKRNQL